jgi:sucrose-6-phosphate hydrolase SacC (GH32 family)
MDEYFVGNFDGTAFTADDTVGRVMDFGKDFYAAQTYNNDPLGRAIVVGWMSNWQYTQVVPTYPWRGIFALPRIFVSATRPEPNPNGRASGPNSYFLG